MSTEQLFRVLITFVRSSHLPPPVYKYVFTNAKYCGLISFLSHAGISETGSNKITIMRLFFVSKSQFHDRKFLLRLFLMLDLDNGPGSLTFYLMVEYVMPSIIQLTE